jgi:2-iminobutanoate/2-iminopropanoate deaminase
MDSLYLTPRCIRIDGSSLLQSVKKAGNLSALKTTEDGHMREAIQTKGAPAAIGPYSQAIKMSDFSSLAFFSGQIPLDPSTGKLVEGSVADETRQVMENLEAVIAAGGFGLEDVIKTTIFLKEMTDFAAVNEVYGSFFGSTPPARATIAVAGLPLGVRIEVEAICAK